MVSNAIDLLIMLKVRYLGDYGKWFRLISALPPSLNVYNRTKIRIEGPSFLIEKMFIVSTFNFSFEYN